MKIEMKHGAGGEAMESLIKEGILKNLSIAETEVSLDALDDASVINGTVFSTDSYTVKPIFFPGGDIGKLAVSGTINDVSALGAKPIALSAGMIVEEGLDMDDFERIVKSMGEISRKAGVPIITGDTKVVEKGSAERIFINTSGIGIRHPLLDENIRKAEKSRKLGSRWLLDSNLADGDIIISSGHIGDHGIAILSSREGYGFESKLESDVQPLNGMLERALEVGGIVAVKDPTRGGLSNALNEWREKSGIGIFIDEEKLPIREEVNSACELLGIDPLDLGNEGKYIIAAVPEMAEEVLGALRSTKEGRYAEIIGRATKEFEYVVMETSVGGRRIVEPPIGDPVPRIC